MVLLYQPSTTFYCHFKAYGITYHIWSSKAGEGNEDMCFVYTVTSLSVLIINFIGWMKARAKSTTAVANVPEPVVHFQHMRQYADVRCERVHVGPSRGFLISYSLSAPCVVKGYCRLSSSPDLTPYIRQEQLSFSHVCDSLTSRDHRELMELVVQKHSVSPYVV